MKTLQQFKQEPESIPSITAWSLAELAEHKGRQDLFTHQSPQKLKVLRENAIIESAVSSNRIEGVEVDAARVGTVVFGKGRLRDRDEAEVRGYQQALKLIPEGGSKLTVDDKLIKRLHALCRADSHDAGAYKEKDGEIIEKHPDGRVSVRFRPVPAAETPAAMRELNELWKRSEIEKWVHPLVAVAGYNLDFLCIHPFRDGNGRVSRLLLLLQLYHAGFEVGRYISIERIIEDNKERYYETLKQSSQGWHEGKHRPWPYVNYLLFILKRAYGEFESRLGQTGEPRGAKSEIIESAIDRQLGAFRVADIQRLCPGVSVDMIRHILKTLRKAGKVECLGRGPAAKWQKKPN